MAEVDKDIFKTEGSSTDMAVSEERYSDKPSGEVKMSIEKKTKELFQGVWKEVLKPALIDAAYNTGVDAMSRIAYPHNNRPQSQGNGRMATDYNAQYRQPSDFRNQPQAANKVRYLEVNTYEDIVISSRMDAANVISYLKDYIYRYQKVSVQVLYENEVINRILSSAGYNFDNPILPKWGWTNLDNASERAVPGGWKLYLPDPVRIKA